jgi:hypothetical protein
MSKREKKRDWKWRVLRAAYDVKCEKENFLQLTTLREIDRERVNECEKERNHVLCMNVSIKSPNPRKNLKLKIYVPTHEMNVF